MSAASLGLVARLEIATALSRRRLMGLNTLVPLILVVPVAFAGAPAHHAAAVYAVLFVLFGTFGAAIPLLRDAERGLVRRLSLSALSPRAVLLERAAAGAAIDAAQLLPALLLIALSAGRPGAVFPLAIVLAATLLTANLLGVLVAAVARSVAEGALFSAVSALLLLHVSGVFRTPTSGSLQASLEAAAPYRALHEGLLAALGQSIPGAAVGPGADGGGASVLLAMDGLAALAGALLILAAALLVAAPRLIRVLARADGRG